jgi:hypothetical protein
MSSHKHTYNNTYTEVNNSIYSVNNIYRTNIISINIRKGFCSKIGEVRAVLEQYFVAVALLQDVGVNEEELERWFVHQGGCKYESKRFLIPGYVVYLNLNEEGQGVTAVAINTCNVDVDKGINVVRGAGDNILDGRMMAVSAPLVGGGEVVFVCVYGYNEYEPHARLMSRLVQRVCKWKDEGKWVVVGGDFNARRRGRVLSDSCVVEGTNEWPWDLDNIVGDVVAIHNIGEHKPTWVMEGKEEVSVVIDYILVDYEIMDWCVYANSYFDLENTTDHACVVAFTTIPLYKPKSTDYNYADTIDIDKLNEDNKAGIKRDMCAVARMYNECMDSIEEEVVDEFTAIKFYNMVNKLSLDTKAVALKHCAKDVRKGGDRKLPYGWCKEIREMREESKVCRESIVVLKEYDRERKESKWCKIEVPITAKTEEDRKGLVEAFRNKVRWGKEQAKKKRTEISSAKNGVRTELYEKYKDKIRELTIKVVEREGLGMERVEGDNTEIDVSITNKYTRDRLKHLGITQWSQIANWDGSDLMPLAAFKTITKSTRLGPKMWNAMRHRYKCMHVVQTHNMRIVLDNVEENTDARVRMIIESNKEVCLEKDLDVVVVEHAPFGERKIRRVNPRALNKEFALLVWIRDVDEIISNIKAVKKGTIMKVRVEEKMEGGGEMKKLTKIQDWKEERNELVVKDIKKMEGLLEVELLTRETRAGEERVEVALSVEEQTALVSALRYKRKGITESIQKQFKNLKESNIRKGVKRQLTAFFRSAKKFGKQRRALLEGRGRNKLTKVINNGVTHEEEEAVKKNTHEYYTSTGKAKIVRDDTVIDFAKVCAESVQEPTEDSVESATRPISYTEVLRKVFTAGNKTAPGADGIPYELLKCMPDCFFRLLTRIYNLIITSKMCPILWKAGDVFLLAKVGEPMEHKHWRPICLQSTMYKVMMAIIADRLLKFALSNNIISAEQKGFCPVSGCFDHTGLLLNMIENLRQNEHELYLIFIDYFNAYGSVNHKRLIQVLRLMKIPEVLIEIVRIVLEESTYVVHTGYGPTDPITLLTGLKQGDPASPVLFILFIEVLLRALRKHTVGFRFKYPFQVNLGSVYSLAFVDDLLVVSDDKEDIEVAMVIIEEFDEWSGMMVNNDKCGAMAVRSDGNEVEDIEVNFFVHGKCIPALSKFDSYKYLGNQENLKGDPQEMEEGIQKKLDDNIKLIGNTALPPWYKVQMAEWYIAAIPMFYLVNGRVRTMSMKGWTKQARKAVRKWIGIRGMGNSVIHMRKENAGLGVPEFEEINEERKVTIFAQFLSSNCELLRMSTVHNLVVELTRRKLIINVGDILNSWTVGGAQEKNREYTMIWSVEQHLRNTGIKLAAWETSENCFCLLPETFGGERFTCRECGKERHTYCDKKGARSKVCAVCVLEPDYLLIKKKAKYKQEYYQDNRYNWEEHKSPGPNPTWEVAIDQRCEGVHHVFQKGNGVWGVDTAHIKTTDTINIAFDVGVTQEAKCEEIGRRLHMLEEKGNIRVVTNCKVIVSVLGEWCYKWVHRYQKTTTGIEPKGWEACKFAMDEIKSKLPRVVVFEYDALCNMEGEVYYSERDVTLRREAFVLHVEQKILSPKAAPNRVKQVQAQRWLESRGALRVQGIVIRTNTEEMLKYAAHYLSVMNVTAEVKVTFLKAALALLPTRALRKKWKYTMVSTCAVCGMEEETVRHILSNCKQMKALYKARHNRVLNCIAAMLVELENANIAVIDKRWSTGLECKYNQPDIVILAPTAPNMIPYRFRNTLKVETSFITDVTVVWDESMEERYKGKKDKYTWLAAVINEENSREGVETGALVFGVLGSIHEEVQKEMLQKMGLMPKEVDKLLKEINVVLAEECFKIWTHVKLIGSFV